MTDPFSLVVLISGSGTTLRNLIARRDANELDVIFRLVVSSSTDAAGLKIAEDAGIPTKTCLRSQFATVDEFSNAIFSACRDADADLVVMGGFLKHVLIPEDFQNRVINIHPSLIPSFCGEGFYGHRVHEAVLDYGAKISGCTVHFVDDHYDHGPIILQRSVPVLDDDKPEDLAKRVFQQECAALPEAIRRFAEGRLKVDGRRVRGG